MSKNTAVGNEAGEQATLFYWALLQSHKYPELTLMFHIPNGGIRSKTEAARMKGEGVKPGVPDIFLPAPKGRYHGLFIELKRTTGGKVSPAQTDWLDRLSAQGYRAEVCRGWQEAAMIIMDYLNTEEERKCQQE